MAPSMKPDTVRGQLFAICNKLSAGSVAYNWQVVMISRDSLIGIMAIGDALR